MFWKYRWAIFWLLVVTRILSPSVVWCEPPTEAGQSPAAAKPDVDLGYVTPDTVAAVVAYPRHVLTDPAMEMLPVEVFTALGERDFGIDPVQVEQFLAITEPVQNGPPGAGIVLRLAAPLADGKVHAPSWDRTVEDRLDGKAYRRGVQPADLSVFRADDRTVLVGNDLLLRKMVSNHAHPKEGTMSKLLGRVTEPPDAMAIVLMEPIRPLLVMPLAMFNLPPQFADVPKIPALITSIGAKVNVTGGASVTLAVRATDEAAAKQLEAIVDKLLATERQEMAAKNAKQLQSSDPVEQANGKYGIRMGERMLQLVRPVRKGNSLTLAADFGQSPQAASTTTLSVLFVLAGAYWETRSADVHAARDAAPRARPGPPDAWPSRPENSPGQFAPPKAPPGAAQ